MSHTDPLHDAAAARRRPCVLGGGSDRAAARASASSRVGERSQWQHGGPPVPPAQAGDGQPGRPDPARLLVAFVVPVLLALQVQRRPVERLSACRRRWQHPFGTDDTGYDMFAFVMRGTQQSLKIAMFIAVFSTGRRRDLRGGLRLLQGPGRQLADADRRRRADPARSTSWPPSLGAQRRWRHLVADRPDRRWPRLGLRRPRGPRHGAVAAREGVRRGGPGARRESTGGSSAGTCCPTRWA